MGEELITKNLKIHDFNPDLVDLSTYYTHPENSF
jgi:hypothetical protein